MYWLLLFVIIIPAIEITIFTWTGSMIGIWSVLFIIILTGLIGVALVKQEGKKTWLRIQTSFQRQIQPTDEILNAICIVIGGIFLLTPGFFTDILGFLLVIPWTRKPFKALIFFLIVKKLKDGSFIYRRW